ncbi:MAG: oxygen-dependent coproporphyrinogen oxidase [Myxococcales bacterium FL481]|nr:MAG: oxygen-dependent coproporphyrinogen oxidase [Myxococcales bacterium FL481]
MTAHPIRSRVVALMQALQSEICDALESIEAKQGSTARFGRDSWSRPGGGGGLSRVIADGAFLERGGVNVSEVHGELDPAFAGSLPGSGPQFFATGVSLVLHPQNPHVPTVHANFRHIQRGPVAWFGGGADLTPYYYDADDRDRFRQVWKNVCERHHGIADYEAYAAHCDRYFYLPHRQERRGVGGIFFDNLEIGADREHAERVFAFVKDAGQAFLSSYLPIVERHLDTPWTAEQKAWQELRRGRYVEFNLLYDRGTVFGLRTNGRTESILMSLPPTVRWSYCFEPQAGSREAELLEVLRTPVGSSAT